MDNIDIYLYPETLLPPTPPRSRSASRSRSLTRTLTNSTSSLMSTLKPFRSDRNRTTSTRSKRDSANGDKTPKHRFTMSSLRGLQQPDLSKRLYKLIKSENHAISAYDMAGRERSSIATQLSEWGESTGDDAISEISDKLGVLLAEIAEQEDAFAQGLEEYRGVLKQIRNTESSVQPARDQRGKVADELQRLKYKEPTSTKIVTLEQELVRAEAQSLVAEAQLTNITRQKLKEAYLVHTSALIERSEKQALLARHARRVLALLDDTPIVPGEAHQPFDGAEQLRQILTDAEDELRAWKPTWDYESDPTAEGAGGVRTESVEAQMERLNVAETGQQPSQSAAARSERPATDATTA